MGCWRVGKERGNSRTIAIGMVRRMKVIGIIEPLNRRRAEGADAGSAVIDRGREKDEQTPVSFEVVYYRRKTLGTSRPTSYTSLGPDLIYHFK